MINQELFINGIRVNLGANFGVRLNRQLISPAELNTKDAQFSYSITLPTGGVNDAAFNYSNIEETRDKFNRVYTAEYIVNGLRIFRGSFKLTSIKGAYKGNLYIPAPKTVKDIFGELKLNQNAELRIPFSDFVTSVNAYNTAAATEPQYAIFPYVLYGVLAKVPTNRDLNTYSARTLWDDTVRTGISDFAPSINPLLMIKHIFNSKGYTLTGSAFQDKKLTRLYVSYKNASEYVQPWNYGKYARMHISGAWSNWKNTRAADAPQLEKGAAIGDNYITDLFDAVNTTVNIVDDQGGNISYKEVLDDAGKTWVNCQIRIPIAGFYKIEFNASIHVAMDTDTPVTDPDTGIQYISGFSDLARADMTKTAFEVRVCRDNGKGDFNTLNGRVNGRFFLNNQPQNQTFDAANTPKYFPQVDGDTGQVNFIDRKQDPNALLGFMFGRGNDTFNDVENPKDTVGAYAQVYAAKPALSWDNSESGLPLTRLAIKSPGWWKYAAVGGTAVYQLTDKYKIDLDDAPDTYAKRGRYAGVDADANNNAQGEAYAVVWLEAGELLTVAAATIGGSWQNFSLPATGGYPRQNLLYDLKVTPFRTDAEWLKVNAAGNGTGVMSWADAGNFDTDTINLVGFLNADMKTDEFIDNFCKAFNLRLSQSSLNSFALDVKQTKTAVSSRFINLDTVASVKDRENTPLGLPSAYKIGFTVDAEERGYVESGDDGGGQYATGAVDGGIVEQKSTFSYNWFKTITKTESGGDVELQLPIISKTDVWNDAMPYPEAMRKRYTDLAYRFWYYNGLLNDEGATFSFNGDELLVARVSNSINYSSTLNYKNQPYTILDNYFTILINGSSHYTELEGALTAAQYTQLDGSAFVMFNGDLYLIAELSAYDPTGKNKTTIKLIRNL